MTNRNMKSYITNSSNLKMLTNLASRDGFVAVFYVCISMQYLQPADQVQIWTSWSKWAHLELKPGSERPKHLFSVGHKSKAWEME